MNRSRKPIYGIVRSSLRKVEIKQTICVKMSNNLQFLIKVGAWVKVFVSYAVCWFRNIQLDLSGDHHNFLNPGKVNIFNIFTPIYMITALD